MAETHMRQHRNSYATTQKPYLSNALGPHKTSPQITISTESRIGQGFLQNPSSTRVLKMITAECLGCDNCCVSYGKRRTGWWTSYIRRLKQCKRNFKEAPE